MGDASRSTTLGLWLQPGESYGLGFVEDYQRCFLEEMGFELRLKKSSGGGMNTKKGQRHGRQERSWQCNWFCPGIETQENQVACNKPPLWGCLEESSFFFSHSLSFFFFWPHPAVCGILVPWPGIKPGAPAVRMLSLKHWTTREFPHVFGQVPFPLLVSHF